MTKRIKYIRLRLIGCLLLLAILNVASAGQGNTQFSQGQVDEGFSNKLSVPLMSYEGRGIDLPVTLNYSSSVWRIDNINTVYNGQWAAYQTITQAIYSEHATAGWKTSLDLPKIEWPKSNDLYTPGGRPCDPIECPSASLRIRRVTIHMPDGSSHELRENDSSYSGAIDMSGTFYAVDGSRLRYDSYDEDTGTLYMPDGTRFVLDAGSGQIIDRNGNTLTYNATNRQWTDTLGRLINMPFPANPSATDYTYQLAGLAGVNGGVQTYTFKWRNLSDVLTPGSGSLRVMASHYLPYPNSLPTGPTGNNHPQQHGNIPSQSTYPNDSLFYSDGEDIPTLVVGKGQSQSQLFNPVVLHEIVLPDGRSYKFTYNIYGEITKAVYPTGAYEEYAIGAIGGSYTLSIPYDQAERGVSSRKLSESGTGSDILEWTYSKAEVGGGSWGNGAEGAYRYRVVAPDTTCSEAYRVKLPTPIHPGPFGFQYWDWNFTDPRNGATVETRAYGASATACSGSLLRRELTSYERTALHIGTWSNGLQVYAYRNIRPVKNTAVLFEGSDPALAQTTNITYDTTYEYSTGVDQIVTQNSNYAVISNTSSSDTAQAGTINQIANGTLAKSTETQYSTNSIYRDANILGLPTKVMIRSGTAPFDIVSQSEMVYDEVQYLDYGYTTTGWQNPNTTFRGNATTVKTWYAETSSWIESHTMHDNFGNVRKVWDTSGDATRFVEVEYLPTYNYAYPTKTKAPAPDPSGVHGMTEGSEISRVYDFHTGLLTSVTDANGQTATTEYNDPLLRPTRINPPAGGSVSETIYNDTPGNLWVKRRQQIDEYNWAESTTYFDNLGRAFKSRTKDLQGDVLSEIKYDNFGRVKAASNPYRADASGNPAESVYWSKPRYDELNRVVETYAPALVDPNSSAHGPSMGVVQFGISAEPNLIGAYTIATDASGRKSRAISGIYGLMRVDEATGIGGTLDQDLGTLANPIQPTSYSYNVKGELVKITQGKSGQPTQYRYFAYDSLGRLVRVRQPEQTLNTALATTGNPDNNSWTAGFSYDVFGNVISMTDAKNTTITNEYDKASRPVKRTYSDSTPQVEFFYDGKGLPQVPQFSRGALTRATSSVSEDRFTSFDNHGRLLASQQITDGQTYNFGYKYNLSGGLIEETYPSGRIVRNFLDSDGGLSAVTTKAANGFTRRVASDFDYSAAGNVNKMRLGNGLWETAQVNERFQLTQVGLGTTNADNNLFKIDYEYGELSVDGTTVDTGKNIGMIARTTTTIPTTNFVQTFKYDAINRLTEAKEKTGTTTNWQQTFGYDRFGNRTQFSQTVNGNTIPNTNINHPTIDQTNNRFTTGQGYVYDFNGNLINDAEGRSFSFNGDDKQTEVRNASNQIVGQYFYDGSGTRVKKVVPSTGETTVLVYDAGGALAAEYSTVTPQPNPTTSYLTTDHLGSPRVITDKTGNVIARRDHMPFGEELGVGVGGRTENQKYSVTGSDNIRKRFTGYEKDDETQLDFAEARMYQNRHGRFTAPDPLLASASALNPQTFNRYIYTGNNPVNYTDPSGLDWCRSSGGNVSWVAGSCGSDQTNINNTEGELQDSGCLTGNTNCYTSGSVIHYNDDGTTRLVSGSVFYTSEQAAAILADARRAIAGSGTGIVTDPDLGDHASPSGQRAPEGALPLPCPADGGCGHEPLYSNPLTQGVTEEELDNTQLVLDGIALTELPIASQGAGVISAIIDLTQGRPYDGLLGVGGLIPFGGNVLDAAKITRRANRVVNTATDVPAPTTLKNALKEVHTQVGKQTERGNGKFGSPMRGNSTKGYRLDPPNPRGKGMEKTHRHLNWWDYSKGKRKSGKGRKGYIPILE